MMLPINQLLKIFGAYSEAGHRTDHSRSKRSVRNSPLTCLPRILPESREIIILLSTVFIFACGGDGGDSGSQQNPPVDSGYGAATLSWLPPTTNTDGTVLNDLAGYMIYYGPEAGHYTQTVKVPYSGISNYLVEGLPVGTIFFVLTAYDSTGKESAYSNIASKNITGDF